MPIVNEQRENMQRFITLTIKYIRIKNKFSIKVAYFYLELELIIIFTL